LRFFHFKRESSAIRLAQAFSVLAFAATRRQKQPKSNSDLEHDPETHAVGLAPTGGNRPFGKGHAPLKIWSAKSIQPKGIAI
jgi:hypothetical protein